MSSLNRNKSLGIMQPYFLPYLGYFQLLNCVDEFILYDNVQYIKGGWVNRNRILENGKPAYITLPVDRGSLSDLISQKRLSVLNRERTSRKMLKRLTACYSSAPFYSGTFNLMEGILSHDTESLGEFIENSLRTVCMHLDITTPILLSSTLENSSSELNGQERVLHICRSRNASVYVNAIGGKELYNRETFMDNGIKLTFLKSETRRYSQGSDAYTPGLSILDVMMHNSPATIGEMLGEYSLI